MQGSKATFEGKKIELSTEIDAVRLLLKNENFAAKYSDYLHPSLFREQLRPIVEIAVKYWQQYRKLCPTQALVQELAYKVGVNFTGEKKDATLNLLYQFTVEPQAPQYTEDQIANFIRFQKLENAVVESLRVLDDVDKQRQGIEKLDDIPAIVNKASAKLDIKQPSFMLAGLDQRTDYRTALACGEIEFNGFGTGIPALDETRMPAKGLLEGELGVWIAATGRGKSIALTNCAFVAAARGFPVVYFSLELPEEMLMNRIDSLATQTPVARVVEERMQVRQILQDMSANAGLAEIVFKDLPCTGVTVLQLKNELTQLQQTYHFEPRLIVVDYMDLLMPIKREKDGWKSQQVVTQELRVLGGEWHCPIWTASQGNRGAASKNEEGEMLTDADVAESYLKLGVTDWAITINRTKAQMKMPQPQPANLHVVKNRTGIANKTIGVLTDFSRMQFYVGDYEESPEKLSEESLDSSAFIKKKDKK
jgi:replicative DNA helicase